jgi:hypothetical protein
MIAAVRLIELVINVDYCSIYESSLNGNFSRPWALGRLAYIRPVLWW